MPCYGETVVYANDCAKEKNKIEQLEAMLCGVLSAIEDVDAYRNLLDMIDWEEMGVKRKTFTDWWYRHKIKDAKRY